MQVFLIKQFSPEYLNSLVVLIHDTIKHDYPDIYPPGVVKFFLDYHNKVDLLRKSQEGTILLGFYDDKLLASGYLISDEIGGVYVHPAFQGKGFGKKIMYELIAIAREQQITQIWLHSTPIAFNFYKSLGFIMSEELTDYVEDNSPLHYYKMYLDLNSSDIKED